MKKTTIVAIVVVSVAVLVVFLARHNSAVYRRVNKKIEENQRDQEDLLRRKIARE